MFYWEWSVRIRGSRKGGVNARAINQCIFRRIFFLYKRNVWIFMASIYKHVSYWPCECVEWMKCRTLQVLSYFCPLISSIFLYLERGQQREFAARVNIRCNHFVSVLMSIKKTKEGNSLAVCVCVSLFHFYLLIYKSNPESARALHSWQEGGWFAKLSYI